MEAAGQDEPPVPASSARSNARPPGDPRPVLRAGWLMMQLVPSPGVGVGMEGAHLSLNWQVTPFVYGWAIDSRLRRTRFFIVEPLYRNSGALELQLSPEYHARGIAAERWGGRIGVRAYFPLISRGEYLSTSVGSGAHFFFDESPAPYFEGGLYTLFGTWGLLMNVSPFLDRQLFQATVRLRWF